jgi:hypothetical protein
MKTRIVWRLKITNINKSKQTKVINKYNYQKAILPKQILFPSTNKAAQTQEIKHHLLHLIIHVNKVPKTCV